MAYPSGPCSELLALGVVPKYPKQHHSASSVCFDTSLQAMYRSCYLFHICLGKNQVSVFGMCISQ